MRRDLSRTGNFAYDGRFGFVSRTSRSDSTSQLLQRLRAVFPTQQCTTTATAATLRHTDVVDLFHRQHMFYPSTSIPYRCVASSISTQQRPLHCCSLVSPPQCYSAVKLTIQYPSQLKTYLARDKVWQDSVAFRLPYYLHVGQVLFVPLSVLPKKSLGWEWVEEFAGRCGKTTLVKQSTGKSPPSRMRFLYRAFLPSSLTYSVATSIIADRIVQSFSRVVAYIS